MEISLNPKSQREWTFASLTDSTWTLRPPKITQKALKDEAGSDINDYLHACWKIKGGIVLANSIDNFIDSHRGDEKIQLCGKLAIIQAIIAAEKNSSLFFDPNEGQQGDSINFDDVQASYLVQLWRLLQAGVELGDVTSIFDNVAVVTFNYDRCIEHFLYHALQQHYSVQQDVAADVISNLPIIHVYGKVGMLPWQGLPEVVPFGGYDRGSSAISIRRLSEGISTYTEQIEDTDLLNAINAEMDRAETVVFLGFSFFPENIQLLMPPVRRKRLAKRIVGTTYGLSESAVGVVGQSIPKLFPGLQHENIQVNSNLKCGNFLQEFGRELTL